MLAFIVLQVRFQENGKVKVLEISMVAASEGPTLETLRIEAAGELRFANQDQLIDEAGNVIDKATVISADAEHPTVARIDLDATFGSAPHSGWIDMHFGGWGKSEAEITFAGKTFVPYTAEYEIAEYGAL